MRRIFHPASEIDQTAVAQVEAALRRCILRAFVGRGLLQGFEAKDMLSYKYSGFSVDTSVRIAAHDRAGLERIDRIAALIPPPRTHRHRYYGVLAPNSPLRAVFTAMALLAVAHPARWQAGPATLGEGMHHAVSLGQVQLQHCQWYQQWLTGNVSPSVSASTYDYMAAVNPTLVNGKFHLGANELNGWESFGVVQAAYSAAANSAEIRTQENKLRVVRNPNP